LNEKLGRANNTVIVGTYIGHTVHAKNVALCDIHNHFYLLGPNFQATVICFVVFCCCKFCTYLVRSCNKSSIHHTVKSHCFIIFEEVDICYAHRTDKIPNSPDLGAFQ